MITTGNCYTKNSNPYMQLFNAMTAETNSNIYVALGMSVSWIITAKATDRLKKQPTHGQTHTRPCIWFTLTKRHCRMLRLCDRTQRRRILSMPDIVTLLSALYSSFQQDKQRKSFLSILFWMI